MSDKLSSQLKRATAFERKSYPLGIDIASQEYFDTLNDGGLRENVRLAPILQALGRLCDAAEDALNGLDNDDWRCDHCGVDQDAGKSNSAIYLREALAEVRALVSEKSE